MRTWWHHCSAGVMSGYSDQDGQHHGTLPPKCRDPWPTPASVTPQFWGPGCVFREMVTNSFVIRQMPIVLI